jgi:hypothetical protein
MSQVKWNVEEAFKQHHKDISYVPLPSHSDEDDHQQPKELPCDWDHTITTHSTRDLKLP